MHAQRGKILPRGGAAVEELRREELRREELRREELRREELRRDERETRGREARAAAVCNRDLGLRVLNFCY